MGILLLMGSAPLIDLCQLMESLRHTLTGHHRRMELPYPTGVLQEDQIPLTPMERQYLVQRELTPILMERPFLIQRESTPVFMDQRHPIARLHPMARQSLIQRESTPILMDRQYPIALLHPMGLVHLTILHVENPLIQPCLLMSLP